MKKTAKMITIQISGDDKQTKAWISPQLPEWVRDTRWQLSELSSAAKKRNPNAVIKLKHTTLTING